MYYWCFVITIIYFINCLIYLKIQNKHCLSNNQDNVLKCGCSVLKRMLSLKPTAYLKNIDLKNFKIYDNNSLLKNFKIAFIEGGVVLIANRKNGCLVIKKHAEHFSIYSKNFNNLKFVYLNKSRFKFSILNPGNLHIKHKNYYYAFKQVLVLCITDMQNIKFGFNIKVLCGLHPTMQELIKSINSKKIFNQKILSFSKKNNAVKLYNFNQPLQNIFNFKINYVVGCNNKFVINNTYVVKICSEFIYVSKIGFNFNFDFKDFFNFKVKTKNSYLNNLINNVLPSKIVSEYKNNFNFVLLTELLNCNQKTDLYFTDYLRLLLKSKQYIRAYNFIMVSVLGVGFFKEDLLFFKPQFYIGSYQISYYNTKLLINNYIGSFDILYKGIVYKNIYSLKLSSKHKYNIDKLN